MNTRNQATPKTLMEAIINALLVGPISEVPREMELSINDFLSQGLTTALFKFEDSPEAQEAIQYLIKLWGIGQQRQEPSELVQAIMVGDVHTVADQLGIRKVK